MTMLTPDRVKAKRAGHDAERLVPDDVVTANGLATHLGMYAAERGAADGGGGDRATV